MKNTSYFTIKFLLFITGLLFTYPCHADLEVALANDTAKQSPRKKLTPALDYTYFEYVGKGYSYNGECSPRNWSLVVKWNDIENDIYKKLICTREEFFANYGEPLESDQGDLQQYVLTSNGQFYASEDPVGTIFTIHETSTEADNTGIYSLQWHMNSTEAQEIFLANPYMPISRAIKFESKDKFVYDIADSMQKILNAITKENMQHPPSITSDEQALLDAYRNASERDRTIVDTILRISEK